MKDLKITEYVQFWGRLSLKTFIKGFQTCSANIILSF